MADQHGAHAHCTHAVENPGYTQWLMSQIEAMDNSVYSPIGTRPEEPAVKPRGVRELMLHFNALLPIGVVYFLLVSEHNIVAAILGFQFICLFCMPLLYIATMPPSEDGKSGGGFAIYSRVLRRLLRNWRKQLKFAVLGFLLFTIVGFCAYLAVHGLINTSHVVHVAESDGLDSKHFGSVWEVVAFALEFTFINSLLEELFWRIFLYRELGAIYSPPAVGGSEAGLLGGSEAGESKGAMDGRQAPELGPFLGCIPREEASKFLVSRPPPPMPPTPPAPL